VEYVEEIPQKFTGEIIFGAAIIKGGNEKLAKEFLNIANDNINIFEKYGWRAVKK